MDIEKIFQETFLNEVQEKNKKQSLFSKDQRDIAMAKKQKLQPFIEFLDLIVGSGVFVKHKHFYSNYKTDNTSEAVPFSYYLSDSSFKYAPGISIFIEHPEIEIAIPNKAEDGAVIIFPSNHNPDNFIISQHFENLDKAVTSLAKFISRCTVKIEKPQNIVTSSNSEPNFFSSIPTSPKTTKSSAQKNIESLFPNKTDSDNN